MKLTTTLQNHLRVDNQLYQLLRRVSSQSKDLYNYALYIQRQQFFETGKIHSLSKLYHCIKQKPQYFKLSSDLAQQVLIIINQNFTSFFKLLKLKQQGSYIKKVRLPSYLDKDDHFLLIFIQRALKFNNFKNKIRFSLGKRGEKSTGTRYFFIESPQLHIEPKQIRIVPKYKATYFEIEYIYDLQPISRVNPVRVDSYLSIDLGLDNFATCATTNETAFIIEGRGIKSFNRWWNKKKAKYQSKLSKNGITESTKRLAQMQRYRKHVINNFLNHAVSYIINYVLDHGIETIVVGEWDDMKNGLKMRKRIGQLFQTLPYRWFKQKLKYKTDLYQINIIFVEESYSSQDCFSCGLRRKANRIHRGLYRCISCGRQVNADVNGSINIMKKVVPECILNNIQWDSGEITSPSRIQVVEFV